MADQDGAPRLLKDDWRRKLMFMRTRADLRSEGSAAAAAELIGKLGPKNLLAAAQNPDHSPFGRRVVEGVLKQRGLSPEPWSLAIPGFVGALAPEQALRVIRRRAGVGRRVLAFVAGLAFVLALVLSVISGVMFAAGGKTTVAMGVGGAALACAGIALLWFVAVALRDSPLRVLTLRRYDADEATDALTRMLARELSPLGHVISLTDLPARSFVFKSKAYNFPSGASFLWCMAGAPLELIRRIAQRDGAGMGAVRDSDGYRRLALRMSARSSLNVQSALTAREVVVARTNADWREFTTDLLVRSADVLVVDVSQALGDEAWELEVARRRPKACVFVCEAEEAQRAAAKLSAQGFGHTLYRFSADGGLNDRRAFQGALAEAVGAALAS